MNATKYISSYFTDGLPANTALQGDRGRKTAIGYFDNRQAVMSFPARLNGFRIPELRDVAAILRGESVADAIAEFNAAQVAAARLAAPTVTMDAQTASAIAAVQMRAAGGRK